MTEVASTSADRDSTVGSGTDAGAAWLVAMLTVSTLPVVVAGAHRLHTRGLKPLTASP
jgi:hypothetical protein